MYNYTDIWIEAFKKLNTLNEDYSKDTNVIEDKLNEKTLYHLSETEITDYMIPRIPKSKYEEQKTPRICLSDSIQGCLIGINEDKDITGKEYFVYELKTNDYYTPTTKEVADRNVTGEVWYLKKWKPQLAYKIKIIGNDGYRTHNINGNSFEVPVWKYIMIKNEDYSKS